MAEPTAEHIEEARAWLLRHVDRDLFPEAYASALAEADRNAALLAQACAERDEARTALAAARLDGARAMREAALVECRKVSAKSDARGAVGGTQQETDRADGARACWSRVEGLDPAAVVGSGS